MTWLTFLNVYVSRLEVYNLQNKLNYIMDIKNVKREHLVDRLILNEKRIDSIRSSINEIIKFSNPIGKILEVWRETFGDYF